MMGQYFELGPILSVTTGRLLCEFDKLWELLDFLTRDSLYTHQIPRAQDECRPSLLRQFPQLAEISGEDVSPENVHQWLADKTAEFGEGFKVQPLEKDEHETIDSLEEAIAMGVDPKKMLVVVADPNTPTNGSDDDPKGGE